MFASLAIAGRYVLREVPPGALVMFRVVGAAIALLAANAVLRRGWVRNPRDLLRLALLGLLGIALNQGLFLFGLRHTTAINATILVTTVPVFTVLGSVLTRQEPASRAKLLGIALAAAGAVWLIGPERFSLHAGQAVGNAMIVAGMLCYASYFLLSKPVLRRYRPLTVSAYAMGFGALAFVPVGLPGTMALASRTVSPLTWAWVAYIVLFPTVLAYLANIWALKRASSHLVAGYIYLQPVFTVSVAPLVLSGEHVTLRAIVAASLIFAGLGLVIVDEQRQQRDLPIGPAGE